MGVHKGSFGDEHLLTGPINFVNMTRQAMFIVEVCTLAILSSASIVLPPDNSYSKFRDRPDEFRRKWQSDPLTTLDGKVGNSDITVHSDNPAERRLWIDYLYPFAAELNYSAIDVVPKLRSVWWIGYAVVSLYLIGLWA